MKKKYTLIGFILEKKLLSIAFLAATVILSVAAPLKSYIIQWLLDSGSKTEALRYMFLGLGIVLVSHISEYFSKDTFTRMSTKSIEQIRNRLMDVQMHKPLREHLEEKTGDMLSVLTNDIRFIQDWYYTGILNIAMWGSMGIVAMVMLAVISPVMLVCAVALCMLPLLVPKLTSEGMSRKQKEYSDDNAAYTGKVGELLKGAEALIAADASPYGIKVHREAAASNRKKDYGMRKASNIISVISSLATWIPNITILFVGVFMVFDGKITMGYLVTINSLVSFVISPFRAVSSSYVGIKASVKIKKKIEDMLNQEAPETGKRNVSGISEVALENVSFAYPGKETPALEQIDLTIRPHEKLALVGSSGGGKSSLIKLLYRYYEDYSGRISVDGINMQDIRLSDYYANVAMVPQTPFIFSDTIYNNLCLYREFAMDEVMRAIEIAELKDFIEAQPEGLDTVLHENGRNLSGGQVQRIAVARAVLHKCDLLLADEITSNLDVITTAGIMKSLLGLECTVVVVTHDIFGDYMSGFDRICYLENGRITEEGNLEALLKLHGGFYELYQTMNVIEIENGSQNEHG